MDFIYVSAENANANKQQIQEKLHLLKLSSLEAGEMPSEPVSLNYDILLYV